MTKPSWTKDIIKMRAGDLLINPRVQRDVHPAQVRALAKNWDELLVSTLTGWRMDDGKVYLLDGQQRLRAKTGGPKLLGVVKTPEPNYMFDVEVYEGITEAEAANIFLGLNRGRKNVDAYARWWVELTAGEPIAVTMQNATDRVGLTIGTSSTKTEIGCVSTLRRVIARKGNIKDNEEALVWALQTYHSVWGHTPPWRSEMVEALALFHLKYRKRVNTADAVKRFSTVTVDSAMGNARMRAIGNNRITNKLVEVLQEEYDRRRPNHTRLEPLEAA